MTAPKKAARPKQADLFESSAAKVPDFSLEIEAANGQDQLYIAGLDEVGRGPLAGPVIAAAVMMRGQDQARYDWLDQLNDSKKISEKKRRFLADKIRAHFPYGYGAAGLRDIDQYNILGASLLAMKRALAHLPYQPAAILVDGNHLPRGLTAPARAVIKGDQRALTIAAASILAKVMRDDLMACLGARYPAYLFEKNAGYGTKAHLNAITAIGPCPHHRMGFAPLSGLM